MNELDIIEMAVNGLFDALVQKLQELTRKGKVVDLSHVILQQGTKFPNMPDVIPPRGVVLITVHQ